MTTTREIVTQEALEALILAEAALGENLQWLTDRFDLDIRQKDSDVMTRLAQLETAWAALAKALGLVTREGVER